MKVYLVGGAVRDQLLGLPVKDRDWVVVGATPETMRSLGYRQVGKDFPVFIHPESGEEYSLARTERKTGSGYYGFSTHFSPTVTLEEDLARRDLTINAIAKTPSGDLIDPFAGQEAIAKRQLRHVSEAFSEDPLRVLRLARFAARFADYHFVINNETAQLCRAMVRTGELATLVPERVWQEVDASLGCSKPQVFFTALRSFGALKTLFPEIDGLFGVPNKYQHHPEIDSGIHTLMTLEQAARLSDNKRVRFATLLHDLGKAVVPMSQWPSHQGHDALGLTPIKALCARYRVPKDYLALALLACEYHILCHRSLELTAESLLSLITSLDALRRPERFNEFLLVCEADSRGRLGFSESKYAQADWMRSVLIQLKSINVRAIVEANADGNVINQALHKAYLQAIETLL